MGINKDISGTGARIANNRGFEGSVNKNQMKKLPAIILAAFVKFYQFALSPLWPNSCRYYPSCSEYTRQAILTHGAIKGVGMGTWRIIRCNPWSRGGYDPVKQ